MYHKQELILTDIPSLFHNPRPFRNRRDKGNQEDKGKFRKNETTETKRITFPTTTILTNTVIIAIKRDITNSNAEMCKIGTRHRTIKIRQSKYDMNDALKKNSKNHYHDYRLQTKEKE